MDIMRFKLQKAIAKRKTLCYNSAGGLFKQFYGSDFMLTSMFWIQAIGYVGMFCHISSFQLKKNSLLFFAQLMGSTIFAIQYLLLGEPAGAVMNVIGVIRNLVYMQGDKAKKPWVLCVLSALVIGGVMYTWNAWYCVFVLVAMGVTNITMYSNNGKIIRYGQLFGGSPCWLAYNCFVGTYAGILCEIFIIISTIVSFIRYGINGFDKNEKKKD